MKNGGYFKELLVGYTTSNENITAFSLYDGQKVTDISYRQFANDILHTAGYFAENNIRSKHIAIAAPNSYKWQVTFFAICASGNVPVPLNSALPNDMLQSHCQQADVTFVVTENDTLCNLRSAFTHEITLLSFEELTGTKPIQIADVYSESSDETVLLLFTSGTTGTSKAVEITSSNLRYSMDNLEGMFAIPGMDRLYPGFPPYHMAGIKSILAILQRYKTICIGRGIKYMLSDLPKLNPTSIVLVPLMGESLIKCLKNTNTPEEIHQYVGTNLQRINLSGAAIKAGLVERINSYGFTVEVMYAMTETTSDGTWGVLADDHIKSVGKPEGQTQLRIQDGEILVKGPSVMKGYYKEPGATSQVIKDGWIHTGDLGRIDENGYLYITGRKKDVMVLHNGENVNPEEIEAAFSQCDDILESMVYNDTKGICAEVYTANQETAKEFIKKYNDSVPMYRQVYKVFYSSAPLEKTGSGKIKRKENAYV